MVLFTRFVYINILTVFEPVLSLSVSFALLLLFFIFLQKKNVFQSFFTNSFVTRFICLGKKKS